MKKSKIKELVLSAYEHVPAYNYLYNGTDLFCENEDINIETDYKNIPVVSKNTIKELGLPNFIDNRYFEILSYPLPSEFQMEHTSGTTGIQMQIFWHKKEYFSSTLEHWVFRHSHGNIYPNSRCCAVLYDNIDEFFILEKNKLLLNRRKLTYNSAVRYLRFAKQFDPEWIYMPGSVIAYLVYVAQREKIEFGCHVKYIEAATEPFIPYYRQQIEQYFHMKVYDMYGCQETNGIAYECSKGHMHVMSNNVYLEILDNYNNICQNGEYGNICVTGLHNTLMPMIRYKLNDIGRILNIQCECGNADPIIELKSCRFPEIMFFDDSTIFDEGILVYPLRRFSYMDIEKDVLFSLHFVTPGKYKIAFRKLREEQLNEYKILFLKIMKAYQLDNLEFEFEIEQEIINTYRVGMIRRQ